MAAKARSLLDRILDAAGFKVTGLPTPTAGTDAVPLGFVAPGAGLLKSSALNGTISVATAGGAGTGVTGDYQMPLAFPAPFSTSTVGGLTTVSLTSGAAYATIQANGTPLAQQSVLNFSSSFATTNNAGASRTDVALAAITPTSSTLATGLFITGLTFNAFGIPISYTTSTSVTQGYTTVKNSAGTSLAAQVNLKFTAAFSPSNVAPDTLIDLAAVGTAGPYGGGANQAIAGFTTNTYGQVSVAPTTIAVPSAAAWYITRQAEGSLSNEFSLGTLTTGLLLNSVSGGIGSLSRAIPGTDYQGPINFADNSVLRMSAGAVYGDATRFYYDNASFAVVAHTWSFFQIPIAYTGTAPAGFQIYGGAHTALPTAEYTDFSLNLGRTVQFQAGNIATVRAIRFNPPTYSFVAGSTITTAATLSILAAPAAGTNATITNSYALWVQAGASCFDGPVRIASGTVGAPSLTPSASTTDGYYWTGSALGYASGGALTGSHGANGVAATNLIASTGVRGGTAGQVIATTDQLNLLAGGSTAATGLSITQLAAFSGTGTARGVLGAISRVTPSGASDFRAYELGYTLNQSGTSTGANRGLLVSATVTSVIGTHLVLDLQVGAVSQFSVGPTGTITTTLGNGLVKSTSGVLSVGAAGTDFESPLTFTAPGLTRTGNVVTNDVFTGASAAAATWVGTNTSLGTLAVYPTSNASSGSTTFYAGGNAIAKAFSFLSVGALTLTGTSGTQNHIYSAVTFAPTSGTAALRAYELGYTVNQTGSSSGSIRGLLVASTVTAALGTHLILDLQLNTVSQFSVGQNGTITTTIGSGLVKSTSGVLSAGAAGTDYEVPLTFTSPGVKRTGNVITNDVFTGVGSASTWIGTTTALGTLAIYPTSSGSSGSTTFYAGGGAITKAFSFLSVGALTLQATSGTQNHIYSTVTFAPTSGNAALRAYELAYTVNQTGTSTGTSRGLVVASTVLAATGTHLLLDLQLNTVTQFSIGQNGQVNTALGTGMVKSTAGVLGLGAAGTDFESPLTFTSPGLTRASNVVSNDVFTGVGSVATWIGATSSGGRLNIYASSSGGSGDIVMHAGGGAIAKSFDLQALVSMTATSGLQYQIFTAPTFAPTSGNASFYCLGLDYTINQTGSANGACYGIEIYSTETSVLGSHTFIRAAVNGSDRWRVHNTGKMYAAPTGLAVATISGDVGMTNKGRPTFFHNITGQAPAMSTNDPLFVFAFSGAHSGSGGLFESSWANRGTSTAVNDTTYTIGSFSDNWASHPTQFRNEFALDCTPQTSGSRTLKMRSMVVVVTGAYGNGSTGDTVWSLYKITSGAGSATITEVARTSAFPNTGVPAAIPNVTYFVDTQNISSGTTWTHGDRFMLTSRNTSVGTVSSTPAFLSFTAVVRFDVAED